MDPLLKKIFLFSFSIGILSVLFAFIAQSFLPPQIPLFYGLPVGEGQLSPSLGLAIPGTVSLFILLVNLILTEIIRESFLKKVLAIIVLVTSLFAIVTTLKIIFLVGSF